MTIITLLVLLAFFCILGFVSIYMRRRCNGRQESSTSINNRRHTIIQPTMSTSSSSSTTPNTSGPLTSLSLLHHEQSSLNIDDHGLDPILVAANFPTIVFSKLQGFVLMDAKIISVDNNNINQLAPENYNDISEQHVNDKINGCSVCLCEFEEGDVLRVLQPPGCGHAFHQDCIDKWFILHITCPLCRHNLRFDISENTKAKLISSRESPTNDDVIDHDMNLVESSMTNTLAGVDNMNLESSMISINVPVDA